jgi:hypothetical protein
MFFPLSVIVFGTAPACKKLRDVMRSCAAMVVQIPKEKTKTMRFIK